MLCLRGCHSSLSKTPPRQPRPLTRFLTASGSGPTAVTRCILRPDRQFSSCVPLASVNKHRYNRPAMGVVHIFTVDGHTPKPNSKAKTTASAFPLLTRINSQKTSRISPTLAHQIKHRPESDTRLKNKHLDRECQHPKSLPPRQRKNAMPKKICISFPSNHQSFF